MRFLVSVYIICFCPKQGFIEIMSHHWYRHIWDRQMFSSIPFFSFFLLLDISFLHMLSLFPGSLVSYRQSSKGSHLWWIQFGNKITRKEMKRYLMLFICIVFGRNLVYSHSSIPLDLTFFVFQPINWTVQKQYMCMKD